ncbi:MAG: Mth938-like domain-containing protein [Pseudomonadota bacterium]
MEITPMQPGERLVIQGYGRGSFKLAGGEVEGSMLIQATRFEPWPVATPSELATDLALAPLRDLAGTIDVLIVGVGPRLVAIDPALRRNLREAGMACEIMTTPAACSTYNVLVAEDRRVAAALIAMPPG